MNNLWGPTPLVIRCEQPRRRAASEAWYATLSRCEVCPWVWRLLVCRGTGKDTWRARWGVPNRSPADTDQGDWNGSSSWWARDA